MKLYLTSVFEWDRIMTGNRTIVRVVIRIREDHKGDISWVKMIN